MQNLARDADEDRRGPTAELDIEGAASVLQVEIALLDGVVEPVLGHRGATVEPHPTFEDLLPGLSDFDTRLFCADGMSADD